jgi:hypothetical protein
MSVYARCDLCGKNVKACDREYLESDFMFSFKAGRRVGWLGVTIYQGRPGRRRHLPSAANHIDLCRDCTLKIIAAETVKWRKREKKP